MKNIMYNHISTKYKIEMDIHKADMKCRSHEDWIFWMVNRVNKPGEVVYAEKEAQKDLEMGKVYFFNFCDTVNAEFYFQNCLAMIHNVFMEWSSDTDLKELRDLKAQAEFYALLCKKNYEAAFRDNFFIFLQMEEDESYRFRLVELAYQFIRDHEHLEGIENHKEFFVEYLNEYVSLMLHYKKTKRACKKAFDLLMENTAIWDAGSYMLLGECYLFGKGTDKDTTKAAFYYTKAAKQNIPFAQAMVGNFYYFGWGREAQLKKAMRYYEDAIKNYRNIVTVHDAKYGGAYLRSYSYNLIAIIYLSTINDAGSESLLDSLTDVDIYWRKVFPELKENAIIEYIRNIFENPENYGNVLPKSYMKKPKSNGV